MNFVKEIIQKVKDIVILWKWKRTLLDKIGAKNIVKNMNLNDKKYIQDVSKTMSNILWPKDENIDFLQNYEIEKKIKKFFSLWRWKRF